MFVLSLATLIQPVTMGFVLESNTIYLVLASKPTNITAIMWPFCRPIVATLGPAQLALAGLSLICHKSPKTAHIWPEMAQKVAKKGYFSPF